MFRVILALVLLVGGHCIFAQEIPPETKMKIEKEVQQEVNSRLKEIVTPLVVAEKLKMEFPPQSPTETVENLDKQTAKLVMEQVDAKYPPSTRDKHFADAKKKYVLYKKGDMVKDLRIRAAGRKSVISGEYEGPNRKGEHVVGGYPIPKVDFENVKVFFDPAVNKKKIETYIKNKMYYFHDDREEMKKKITPVIKNDLYTKAGYYKSGDDYFPALDFLKKSYEKEKEKVKAQLMKEVENELLAKYNLLPPEENLDDPLAQTDKKDKKSTTSVGEETVQDTPVTKNPDNSNVRKRIPLFDPSFYDPNF